MAATTQPPVGGETLDELLLKISFNWLLFVQVLTSVTDGDGGVAVSLATSQHALVAILKLLDFKEFKHKDFKSGQHLLWRELP